MNPEEQENRRRNNKRYSITSSAFALLKWNGSEVLGSINDISQGGFCLSHIDDNGDPETISNINIKLISEKICFENFTGSCIWCTKEEGGFTTTMVNMKRRGIEFRKLNDEQRLQLEEFIDSLEKK